MTGEQRLRAAADMAAREALAAADKAAERKARNMVAQARESQRLASRAEQLKSRGSKQAHHDALFERMVQLENFESGIRNELMSDLMDAVQAVEPRFLGLLEDPASVRAFAKAVLDGDTSDPAMTRAAKVYTETFEAIRVRMNNAGADIGKLDYSYLPQPHDVGAVARAGADQWVADTLPRVARDRYVRADGALMDDAEVEGFLRAAWTTIATEGRNKRTPGQSGVGSRASRFDDAHRAIHFKDADAYLGYLQQYGRGSMMEAIVGHVGMSAKNLALMEEWGANPNTTFRLMKDTAENADNAAGKRAGIASPVTLDQMWDTLSGTTAQPVSARMAQVGQTIRSYTVAAKLQGTLLSSITDVPLQLIVAKTSGVPLGGAMKSLFAGFGKSSRRIAHEMALGADEIAGELSRWHDGNMGATWANKLASTTMRLGLVEGWTNALRRGFALTYSGTLERMRRTEWGKLAEFDRRTLEETGVTPEDWAIWQLAEPTMVKGVPTLTKQGLRGIPAERLNALLGDAPRAHEVAIDRATARMIGHIDALAKTAMLSPNLRTRAFIQSGGKAGTVPGEMWRMLFLFKSFPLAVVDKHVQRIRNIPSTSGKAAYSAALLTSLTMFGAIALQLKDLINGKDPRDMTTPKFWGAAFMQGGGLGIFGDMLYTAGGGNARGGQANWTGLAGPVFGTAFDAADVTLGNAVRASQGKDVDLGADVLRLGKQNTPFVNLWYARGAIDHLVLHDLQEQASPGYLRRMRQRARKDWGQRYWWEPGEPMPERAPDFEAVTGKD
jgi:hypothetical protein